MIRATGKIVEGFKYTDGNRHSLIKKPSNQVIAFKNQIHNWYSQYCFHAFVTLTFNDEDMDTTSIDTKLKYWIRNLYKSEKMQFCYMGIISKHYGHSRKHIHLLMYGKNRFGKIMTNCNLENFKLFWGSIVDIKIIYDSRSLNDYVVYRNMGASFEIVKPYNPKLLKKILR